MRLKKPGIGISNILVMVLGDGLGGLLETSWELLKGCLEAFGGLVACRVTVQGLSKW